MKRFSATLSRGGKPKSVVCYALYDGKPQRNDPEGIVEVGAVGVKEYPLNFHSDIGRIYGDPKSPREGFTISVFADGCFFPYWAVVKLPYDWELDFMEKLTGERLSVNSYR